MCMMCEGATRDEVLFAVHHHVVTHGWAVQGVEAGPAPALGWFYSVGLSGGFGHPELVVVGGNLLDGAAVIDAVCELVRDGASFAAGDEIELSFGSVAVGAIHPVHVAGGLIAVAEEYHDAIGSSRPMAAALQVLLPDGECCARHQQSVPRLADPSARLRRGSNRAQRRRDQRSKRGPRNRRDRRSP